MKKDHRHDVTIIQHIRYCKSSMDESETTNQRQLSTALINFQNAQCEIPLSVVSSVLYWTLRQLLQVFRVAIDVNTKLKRKPCLFFFC